MAELQPKKVSESITKMVHIVFPGDCNGQGRLFGGRLMEWMDVIAGIVARRHANRSITTASVDNLQFKGPAHTNDTIVLRGKVTYVGTTSMEVRVDSYVEQLNGQGQTVRVWQPGHYEQRPIP